MQYTKRMPAIKELRQLAREVENYPITGLGIAQYAEHMGYNDDTVDFIKLFSRKMVFVNQADFVDHCSLLERLLTEESMNQADFVDHCSLLERLLTEESKQPYENLKSPQE